jgi:hypothetical protein
MAMAAVLACGVIASGEASASPIFQNNGSNSIAEGVISGVNGDGSHTFFSTMWQVKLYMNVSVLTYQP